MRVLRVLNGRLAGSEKAAPQSGSLSIGPQYWQNVVIRTPEAEGTALELEFDESEVARLTVLTGEATLLGSTVAEGQTAMVPPYVPFTIGGIALAWGDKDSERWADAGGIVSSLPAPLHTPPSAREHAIAIAERARTDLGGLVTKGRVIAVVAGVLLLIVLLNAMTIVDALGLRGTPQQRVERRLADAGLHNLHTANRDGVIAIQGVVRNAGDRTKAQAAVADMSVPTTMEVRTSDELAAATAEVAHVQGLEATARAVGLTVVELHTTPLTSVQNEQLRRSTRTDVPGVTQLVIQEDLQSQEDAAIKTVADVTKKVSTVVAGDPAYIQTADGTRYFAGAMMPTGHRLVLIEGQSVVLEKNGHQIRLRF